MKPSGRESSAKDALAAQHRHLVRKMSHAVHSMHKEGLPADLLGRDALEATFCGATGFPEAADSVAYEPTQGLLAVGTSDGRVVLLGQPGVECTLRSASRSPTMHLCFLPHKGALLRVTQDGDCQLFSAVSRRLLTSIWLQGDVINSVTLLPAQDPYVLLGCESGNVRVVALLDADGQPASGARPATDLSLQPYQVLGQEVDGKSGVVAVSVAHLQRDKERPLLLLVHRHSGALVWDLRAERILCVALDAEDEHSKPTCACWVGERANCFAVGYDDGSILVWAMPPAALQGDPFKVIEPPDAQLSMTLRVAARGVRASAIHSLSFMPGGDGGVRDDCLLVFGGQGEGEPDMLTLLALAPQPEGDGGGRQVPWFGNVKGLCMMPAQGSLSDAERPRGLMILTEGGQLVVHDLQTWQPTPLTLPIQELPPITLSRLVPSVSVALLAEHPGGSAAVSPRTSIGRASASTEASPSRLLPGSSSSAAPGTLPQHCLTLEKVRACSRRAAAQQREAPPVGASHSLADHWPFAGGEPACSVAAGSGDDSATGPGKRHPSAFYFTGHRDGRVRVWDATMQVPELLLTVPASAGQERLRAVTALEVCPFSGIVIAGHLGGDVRLYQFTEGAQTVHRMNIDETLLPYENVATQAGGFQYIMRYSAHSADISSVALATKLKLAAVADAAGNVSLLDLLQPAQLFASRSMAQPVAQLAFGSHVFPGATKEEPDIERMVLFLAGADSSACMVDLDKGELVGRPMKPKNSSPPLSLVLLDASGIPLPMLHGQLVLHWANNNGGTAAAPGGRALSSASRNTSLRDDDQVVAATAARVARLSLSEHAGSAAPLSLPHASSRRSTAAESHRTWSRAGSADPDASGETSLEVQELPSCSDDDDELDSHLAAAVQAVEEEKKAKRQFKLPKAFQRPGSRGSAADKATAAAAAAAAQAVPDADLPSPTSEAGSSHAAASGAAAPPAGGAGAGGQPVSASHQRDDFYGVGADGGEDPASPVSPTAGTSPLRDAYHGARGGGGGGDLLSQADLVDYPYLIDGDPTPAAYLLLCCADYLRLYTTDNIRLGDRTTERKASFEAELCFAAPFMSVHGPGVASIDASDALQVHSLPGLALLCRKQLEDSRVLGFRWPCQPSPGSGGGASAASCCSPDGQLVLVAAGNEIARLAVVADCALPAAPAAVYNMRVAQAAAAAAAHRRQPASGGGAGAGGQLNPSQQHAAPAAMAPGDGGETVSPSAAGAAVKSFGRFFDHAAATVTVLASTAMQELDKARTVGQSALHRLGGEGGPSRALPSLEVLFATPVEPMEDDIDYMAESEDAASTASGAAQATASTAAAAAPGAPATAAAAAAAPAARKGSGPLLTPREAAAAKLKQFLPAGRKSERSELLDRAASAATTADAPAGGSSGTHGGGGGWSAAGRQEKQGTVSRTASAIKRAYGRPGNASSSTSAAASKTGDVRSIMEQNREMLAERGERLKGLDERTAAMQGDAEDFASLAKQLADQQANRKWYQL